MPIYGLNVGDNSVASFANFSSSNPTPLCTKEAYSPHTGKECNWNRIGTSVLPVVIATMASGFSGEYLPAGSPPDTVTYQSYITYEANGWRFIYPSSNGNLGTALIHQSALKILGQSNMTQRSLGVDTSLEVRTDIWNTIRKNVALLSRNRTAYADVDYTILRDDPISIDATSFDTKRTIVVIGADVNITDTIPLDPDVPYVIIALTDAAGNGGNIRIHQSVRDIHANLFAERSILSSGDNQLYIHGMVLSLNTIGKSIFGVCPFYVTACSNPEDYDFEKIRKGYMELVNTLGHTALSPRALEYPKHAVIIEYDGRILTDPPIFLQK